jgi:hypothetical protein
LKENIKLFGKNNCLRFFLRFEEGPKIRQCFLPQTSVYLTDVPQLSSPQITSSRSLLSFIPQAPPRGFTSSFLDWTKATFQLQDDHVETLVQGAAFVCTIKGCLNALEIGAHCCPF